jgi:hypothetical protein
MKKVLAKQFSKGLEKSADGFATINKTVVGAQKLPQELKRK